MKNLFKTFAMMAMGVIAMSNYALAQESCEGHHHENHSRLFARKDFGVYLGLNTFYKPTAMPDLKPWDSRYVALQWRKNQRLFSGRQMDVALGTGWEMAWNNYMFDKDIRVVNDGGIADFVRLNQPVNKSKLVVANINVPLMLQFGFHESNFRLGFGVYGGVRVDSYQKIEGGRIDKIVREHDSYNLNKFNYGFMAEAGGKGIKVFVKYDMKPLFKDLNDSNANAISFGVRI